MSNVGSDVKVYGEVEIIIDRIDGSRETKVLPNTILKTGRTALAKTLVNDLGDSFGFYVNRMIFGDNGTDGGTPKYVTDDRNGLFGVTVLSKPVISSIDPNVPTQAIFTSVVSFTEANSLTLNEMALQLANGDLYSMRTFADLNKTNTMQITFNWRISFM